MNHGALTHTKTPFSSSILVYVYAVEGLRKRAGVVARDDQTTYLATQAINQLSHP